LIYKGILLSYPLIDIQGYNTELPTHWYTSIYYWGTHSLIHKGIILATHSLIYKGIIPGYPLIDIQGYTTGYPLIDIQGYNTELPTH